MVSSLTVVLVLAAAVCAMPASGNRIVGGEVTNIERYPSIVQVDFFSALFWSQSCGANIITSWHVLSAAHCFSGIFYNPANRRIRAGSSNRNSGGEVIRITRSINHPSYSSFTLDADISVIVLASPLTFSPTIQPVAIISQGEELPDNLPVIHAGWGTVSSGGSASALLRHVTIYTVNREVCRQRYASGTIPRRVTDNMICAGILDVGGKDACQGDSGGPLYYDNNGAQLLVGIVSWGEGCAHPTFPGVSAAVSPFTQWIVQTAAEI